MCSMLTAATLLAGLALFAPLPQQAFNSVVAIGRVMPDGSNVWIASGFLYAYVHRPGEKGDQRYRGFVVTNRHVVTGSRNIVVRFNPGSHSPQTNAEIVTISLINSQGEQNWTAHPNEATDVAAIPYQLTSELLAKLKHMAYIIGEPSFDRSIMAVGTISSRRLKESAAAEGDDVSILGFPIGVLTDQLFGANRNYPVLRRGVIAWVRPALESLTPDFLVDALIFPGNSGGPVMRQCPPPTPTDVCLIGMVKGYLPYSDSASSRQTGRTRITFEENSGLAVIIPVDEIDRTIAEHFRRTEQQ